MDIRKKTTGGAFAKLLSDLRHDSVDHKSLQHKVDAKYATRILVMCVKNATSVFTQIKAQCVLRCFIHIYKSDSIQETYISLYYELF